MLDTSVRYVKGIGPQIAQKLHDKLSIRTIEDLINYFPISYLDRSSIKKIADLKINDDAIVEGDISNIRKFRTRRMNIVTATISDQTSKIKAVWFNQPYLANIFKSGQTLILSGKVDYYNGLQIKVSDFELLKTAEPIHYGKIIPAYRLSSDINKKFFRRSIQNALDNYLAYIDEYIPEQILKKRRLIGLFDAYMFIHFPDDLSTYQNARRRLVYDEFFLWQIALGLSRNHIQQMKPFHRLRISSFIDSRIRARFPFKLTGAQEKVIREIKKDLTSERPMNRLLQGDVGSGKTIVCVYAALAAIANKTQVAVMAPTEILARQHYETFSQILEGSKVRILFLGGETLKKKKDKKESLEKIASGEVDLVIGTHSLIQKNVHFKSVSLVVVDEQHKFGVFQRKNLIAKGKAPHTLIMTATPIPRTLALTIFGDLDLSIIDEMPPGRIPPRTFCYTENELVEVFDFIHKKIKEGRQAYLVYPAIEESDEMPQLKSAKAMFERLCKQFKECSVGLLHGKMSPEDKKQIMSDFRSGKINILVSTIVIEVGVDVPNATIMVIDNAERYGLGQLHQLRGRIGRGQEQSFCILIANPTTEQSKERLKVITSTTNGFKIAEEDMKIRGTGEILGSRQSGVPNFKLANLLLDQPILQIARQDAMILINNQNFIARIIDKISRCYGARLVLAQVG